MRLGKIGVFLTFSLWAPRADAHPQDLGALAAEAKRAMEARQFERAAAIYEEMSRAAPGNAGLVMNAGLARFSAGNYEAAAASLEKAARMDPRLWPARLMLGLSYLKLGRAAAAVAPLESVVMERPGDAVARFELAAALLETGRFGDAARHLRKLTDTRGDHTQAWYGLAVAHDGMARDAVARVQKLAPDSVYALALAAGERADAQQYVSAVQLYRQALARQPLPGLHQAIAEIYRATGQPDWAEKEARREAQVKRPDCASEPFACAVLEGRGIEVAGAPPANDPAALYWQALAHKRLAQEARARLEQLPASAELHRVRAERLESMGRHADAAAEWRAALALAPGDGTIRRRLARSLWRARDYEAAIPLLRELAAAHPSSADAHYQLGDSLLEREGPEAAIPHLQRALELDPDLLPARASLGKAYMRANQAAKAIPFLEAARAVDSDGAIHYQLARAYRAEGNEEAARAAMEAYAALRKAVTEADAERNRQSSPPPP